VRRTPHAAASTAAVAPLLPLLLPTTPSALCLNLLLPHNKQVDRLMDMIVNSLYSNREVFLRELISNASDALDKVRFVGVTDPKALEGRDELEILIKADKDAKTITIE
jgi:HEAT repeat protein